jgi:hypothetical protein
MSLQPMQFTQLMHDAQLCWSGAQAQPVAMFVCMQCYVLCQGMVACACSSHGYCMADSCAGGVHELASSAGCVQNSHAVHTLGCDVCWVLSFALSTAVVAASWALCRYVCGVFV